jgi:hypothetical protein
VAVGVDFHCYGVGASDFSLLVFDYKTTLGKESTWSSGELSLAARGHFLLIETIEEFSGTVGCIARNDDVFCLGVGFSLELALGVGFYIIGFRDFNCAVLWT